jgi:hypothetical protein
MRKITTALIVFVCLVKLTFLSLRAFVEIKDFIKAKGHYLTLKETYQVFKTSSAVKAMIPPNSTVSLMYKEHSIEVLGIQYSLYPIEITGGGAFIIDLDNSIQRPPQTWDKVQLDTGATVYAKEGYNFTKNHDSHSTPTQAKIFTIFMLIILYHAGIGFMLFSFDRNPQHPCRLLSALVMNYLIGIILFTSIIWVLLLLGLKLNFYTLIIANLLILIPLPLRRFWNDPVRWDALESGLRPTKTR